MATLGGITTEVTGNRCSPEIDNLASFAVEENKITPEIDSLARFAVEEHNKKSNAVLQFVKVMSAVLQNAVLHFGKVVGSRRSPHLLNNGNMVGGDVYCLTLEASDGGKKKIYEAQVWKKPWLNFKALKEFKLKSDAPSGSRA